MPQPKIGLKLPTTEGRPNQPVSKTAGEWGEHAETLGYDSIWMSEGWGADALLTLAEVAARTDELRLCTAIVNTYSRTPAVLAMAGATLQRRSGGRAVLGVGASHAGIVEPLHGIAYERPVRRTHEAIELIKELTGGSGDVTYHGEIFDLEGYPAFETAVPVYNAALGAANRRATGRVADGWLPYLFPISALGEGFDTIEKTAREVGRDPADIEVTPQILAAVSDDTEEAKENLKKFIAPYIGNLPNYRDALATWFPAEAEAISNAWHAGGLEAAKTEVTDELVFELGVAGTADSARQQLQDLLQHDVIDCPILYVPRSAPQSVRDRTIEELQPEQF